MKRLRVILLFLLLGAIVNVAVAWGIALTRNITDRISKKDGFYIVRHADRQWLFAQSSEPGSGVIEGIGLEAGSDIQPPWREVITNWEPVEVAIDTLPQWSGLTVPPQLLEPPYLSPVRTDVARGWPFLAVSCRMDAVFEGDRTNKPRVEGGFRVGEFPGGTVMAERVLPYRPLWLGFAINTLFYTAILWLLLYGMVALRRHFHVRRGHCVKCGYDLRGAEHEACPECGEEIRKSNPA